MLNSGVCQYEETLFFSNFLYNNSNNVYLFFFCDKKFFNVNQHLQPSNSCGRYMQYKYLQMRIVNGNETLGCHRAFPLSGAVLSAFCT